MFQNWNWRPGLWTHPLRQTEPAAPRTRGLTVFLCIKKNNLVAFLEPIVAQACKEEQQIHEPDKGQRWA